MAHKFTNKFYRKEKVQKYRNKKVTLADGTSFSSKKEYERWLTLSILQNAGHIQKLNKQVPFDLIPAYKGVQKSVKYIADFVYYENGKTNLMIVEDTKSDITRKNSTYIIKKKLMYHLYKIIIKEV